MRDAAEPWAGSADPPTADPFRGGRGGGFGFFRIAFVWDVSDAAADPAADAGSEGRRGGRAAAEAAAAAEEEEAAAAAASADAEASPRPRLDDVDDGREGRLPPDPPPVTTTGSSTSSGRADSLGLSTERRGCDPPEKVPWR